jgi:opacity protein-like surface antigen
LLKQKEFMITKFLTAAACLLCLTIFAAAQTIVEAGKNEFSVWSGASPDSSTVFKGSGRTRDAAYGMFAVRYARRFDNSDGVNLKYTIDAIPAAVLSDKAVIAIPTTGSGFALQTRRKNYYGFGLAPLGLQINLRPHRRLQPFVEGSGGFLYFNKILQNNFGSRFNFTANVGAGFEYRLKNNRSVTFGYKYFHISNGGRGLVNPGIDNNLFYVGVSFFKN